MYMAQVLRRPLALKERKHRLRPTTRPPPLTPSSGSSDVDARLYYVVFASLPLIVFAAPPDHPLGTVDEQQIARNVQALKNRLRGRGGARVAGRGGGTRGDTGSGRDSHPNSECVPFFQSLIS